MTRVVEMNIGIFNDLTEPGCSIYYIVYITIVSRNL
jgi:hypothetical protein